MKSGTRWMNLTFMIVKPRWVAFLSFGWAGILSVSGAEVWWAATDTAHIQRTGEWKVARHRYAAEPALETRQDGAALELAFHGRALVLGLDTLTPPNNYGPPELGALEVFIDDVRVTTVRPRGAANEVTLLRSPDDRAHRVRLVHRSDGGGTGARIHGFRVVTGPSGDLAFFVSGEKNGALIDARAILTRDGQVVRDVLVRNRLTGECRLAGLPPGTGYALELRAAGWRTFHTQGITVGDSQETVLPPVYLPRERDVPQDAFTFPSYGYPAVRLPGGTFRARFEGHRAKIHGVRLVRRVGPARISRACLFMEDKAAAFYYHREGEIAIPTDTPPGTYDLEIALGAEPGGETLTSPRSVTVVSEYPADPVFVSWGHLDTWGQYQAEYVAQLVAIANLLAPDMVLISNEGNPAYAAGALYGLEMPFVINFGNHRGPEPGPWFGPPVGTVDFGSSFTVLNFGRAWNHDTSGVDKLLAERVGTRLKIVNAFEANAPVREFLDRHRVALIHYGHGPGPVVGETGATPTVRVGKSSSESFRVIRFRESRPVSYTYRGHETAPIPFRRGARSPVGIRYEPANDGTHREVTAHVYNELEELFANARVTFVLPAGAYLVQGGRVEHAIRSDDAKFTVLSVRCDLPAQSRIPIVVRP